MAPPKKKSASLVDEKQQTIPAVSFGKPSLKARLEAYYSLTQPDLLSCPVEWRTRFDQIWDKFGGTESGEQKLAAKLAKKYGTSLRFLTAGSSSSSPSQHDKAESSNEIQNSVEQQFPEEWYQLNDKEKCSGCVDFTSDRFDPVAALSLQPANNWRQIEPTVAAYVRGASILDRVDQFCSYLPTSDPLFRAAAPSKSKSNKKRTAAEDDSNSKKPKVPSCFAATASLHETGPLSVLYKAFTQRYRVRVVIRYVNCIRGTLTGYLTAFDKHMNLILQDVDENYSPRRIWRGSSSDDDDDGDTPDDRSNAEAEVQRRIHGTNFSSNSTKSNSSRNKCCWTNRQRHFRQIMVRGDVVVAVYKAADERSAWPVTNKSPSKSMYRCRQSALEVVVPAEQRVGTPGSLIYSFVAAASQQQGPPLARNYYGAGQHHRDYKSYS